LCVKERSLFNKVTEFDDRTEYTFWQKVNLSIDKIRLNEGQSLKWFTKDVMTFNIQIEMKGINN
jgi:hypothetical protein